VHRRLTLVALAAGFSSAGHALPDPSRHPVPPPATGTAPVGYQYTVRTVEDGEATNRYRVRVLGSLTRIDGLEPRESTKARDYLLVHDNGQRVIVVHPDERSYSEATAEEFESIIGSVLRKADKVMTIKMRRAAIKADRLGAGEALLGLPTERTRLTQDFTVGIGAFGFTKDVRQRIVTEYWVSKELPLASNPAVMLLATVESALAQHDPDFVRRSRKERLAICPGMPLRMTVTTYSEEEGDMTKDDGVKTIEVVDAKKSEVDAKTLAIPSGYRKETSKFGWRIDL
jgi:hypothetical protein